MGKKKKLSEHEFKKPGQMQSILGLQQLAEKKRKIKQEIKEEEEDEEEAVNSDRRDGKNKQYRKYRPETPSHPGGVNREAVDKIKERKGRDKEKGVYAETGRE